MGATAGRTTLLGEGLQHQDGHSLVLAGTVPPCQAYDPAFAYELAAIVKHGIRRMYGPSTAGVDPDVFYYLTLYNENYQMPPIPDRPGIEDEIVQGLYRWQEAPEGPSKRATIVFSGSAQGAARQAAAELAEHYDVGVELWSATSYKALRDEALAVERWNRLHPGQSARTPLVTRLLADAPGPVIAVTDFMKLVPEQVARFVPDRPFVPLGTDGFGRSDNRPALRDFFEIDRRWIVVKALKALAEQKLVPAERVSQAIKIYGIKPDRVAPWMA